MGLEIERKFLVNDLSFKEMATAHRHIAQGYLNADPERTVRVRIADGRGYITVKGITAGATRHEWEYAVPQADAAEMLALCTGIIDKTRYIVPFAGRTWEVDEFHGALAPLVLAEVELPSEDAAVTLPPFIAAEVTGDPAYYNSTLAKKAL